MMKNILTVLMLFFVLTLEAQEPTPYLPDFEFQKLDSTSFKRTDLDSTKNTLIIFFDATCGHCKDAMIKVNKNYEKLYNTNVVLVSLDVEKSIHMFLTEFGPKFWNNSKVTILHDGKYEFVPLFNPKRYPSLYLYSPKRDLLVYANNDDKMEEIFKLIDTANHNQKKSASK
ncbi:peroxiredoxin family protein [Pseudopedobacter saltans]|nr:redoxin domain-containing protein [Pseudopedobacter saltans]